MHWALRVCEILLEIFAHVNEVRDPLSYQQKAFARKSLAALAATCKTFYEPAMNELWAVMYGLTPLLGCVTRLYPIIYCNGLKYSLFEPPIFIGIKPLSENEGRQFLRHAARMRSMYILIKEDGYRLLSVLRCTLTCMFPRLLSLRNPCLGTYSDIFLSPTLRRCDLWVTYPDLKVIVTRCAVLEHLSLGTLYENTANELSLLSDCLRLCKRLVTLSCPPLDSAAWRHLSNLPTLTEIEIDGTNPSSSDFENHLDFGPFLNLAALSFTSKTAAYITALVQHSDFPSLQQFRMRVARPSWTEAERLIRVLSQCKAYQTLEQICMHSWASSSSDVQDPRHSYITHFYCFTQLRILRLTFPHCCIHLDNDLFLEIMSSWPHLRSLHLEDSCQTRGTITFRGLIAALRQCPHLHELDLWIDAVNIDIDPTTESFRHTSLQELNVLYAQVVDVEAVTRIIFSMLPCVDMIYHRLSLGEGPMYAWPDVKSRLQSLHGVHPTEPVET